MKKYETPYVEVHLTDDIISTSGVTTGAVRVPWETAEQNSGTYDGGYYPSPTETSYNLE